MRYLRPVPVDVPLTVKGAITTDGKPHRCEAEAILLDGEGNVLAKGEGEFAILSGDRLKSIPDDFRQQMTELFKKY